MGAVLRDPLAFRHRILAPRSGRRRAALRPVRFAVPIPDTKSPYAPCLPTRGTAVPARDEWLHEVKHDGYRLIVQRAGKVVRLFTRNGHDWTPRYPLIVEAALRHRAQRFVLDGEAVLLGVDGRSDFDGLQSWLRKFGQ
ncbi:hypothetical protein [Bradyrhizobium septentrionale]|uniref:ATP-dependent DNA ligase n=1 Tax=Bradyrhizobium septentrionale TaxID=1404411 RepID=UPI0030B83F1A